MWTFLFKGLFFLAISWLLRPKPEHEPPKQTSLANEKFPRAKQGAELGIAWGTPWIYDMQEHWSGDPWQRPVRQSTGKKG